jgi:hypothetical protein
VTASISDNVEQSDNDGGFGTSSPGSCALYTVFLRRHAFHLPPKFLY